MLSLSGDWIAASGQIPTLPADALAQVKSGRTLALVMDKVGRWDSLLIAFLGEVSWQAEAGGCVVDAAALPAAARTLLGLLTESVPVQQPAVPPRRRPVRWIGTATLAVLDELGGATQLLGRTLRAAALLPFGRVMVRFVDIAANL